MQIEKIKNLLIKKVQSGSVEEHFSITEFLSKALNKDYSYISRLFSAVEGITIEQFFILQKIEKVKELIIYNEINGRTFLLQSDNPKRRLRYFFASHGIMP